MNERHKKIIDKLTNQLRLGTLNFLNEHLEDKENASHVVGIIISSHITSLINLLEFISKHNPDTKESLDKFTDNIIKFLSTQDHESMEVRHVK